MYKETCKMTTFIDFKIQKLCDGITFKLFTNFQTFYATTRLNFAFLTFSRCFLL